MICDRSPSDGGGATCPRTYDVQVLSMCATVVGCGGPRTLKNEHRSLDRGTEGLRTDHGRQALVYNGKE